MTFTSLPFFALLAVALVATHTSAIPWRSRKLVLLGLSYLFYSAWNAPFVGLLLTSTVVDWLCARRVHQAARKWPWVTLSLVTNLGLLAVFKYSVLVTGAPDFVLPVGISFYTFQTISYTVDVARGHRAPAGSFLDYALYVTFFPQLVAGPIVRADEFLPQLEAPARPKVRLGITLIAFGLFQKVVLADAFLSPTVERVFDGKLAPTTLAAWTATLAFSAQIFCDFAGYSLVAIGVAALLGFHLPDNFRLPYAARSFSEFWRRWHVSLSSWLRDYLYISLGGNRHGNLRTVLSLFVTMFLGGLWHGASWTFAIWGVLHGVFLGVERLLRTTTAWRPPAFLSVAITQLGVLLAWVFFRADGVGELQKILGALVGTTPGELEVETVDVVVVLVVVSLVYGIHLWMRDRRPLRESIEALEPRLLGVLVAILLLLVLWAGGEDRAFIYFQF